MARIYLATSWRNEHQPRILALLREAGHEVYVGGLQHPRAQEGFRRDFDAMRWCDICVVLMPCGPSAALEAGWCKGSGRGLIVHVAGMREPDLMYLVADAFTLSDEALLREVETSASMTRVRR